jgi:quinol monooxygenase YgiN
MIIVSTTMNIDPARVDEVRELSTPMLEGTRAEPGNVAYTYSIDILQPDKLRIFGMWLDDDAFQEHMTAPHMAEWLSAARDLDIMQGSESRRFQGTEITS